MNPKVKLFIARSLMVLIFPIIIIFALESICRLKYTPSIITNAGPFEYHPNKVFSLKKNFSGTFSDTPLFTNSLGYRDDPFLKQKKSNEIRIISLGDSVTFGDGVVSSETFPQQLEANLGTAYPNHHFQVINAGVPGNSSMQEYYDLLAAKPLQPDFVILQFTLNDVTEPFGLLKRLGGSGWSYHGIYDVPAMDYYLSQRSSLYIFGKRLYAKMTYQGSNEDSLKSRAKMQEIYQKEKLITHHQHESIKIAWEEYFSWLRKIVMLSNQQDIPLILLISPFEFQLTSSPSTDYPQQKLSLFCKDNNIQYIDLLQVLRLKFNSFSSDQSDPSHPSKFWDIYFNDHDHYSPQGHQLVASLLIEPISIALNLNQ